MITGHGGNIYRLAETLGCPAEEIIDMSSNINPLGPVPGLLPLLKKHLESIKFLPESDAAGLIRSASHRYGISHKKMAAGTGTTQLIYALPKALKIKTALIIGPTYSDYSDACTLCGVKSTFLYSESKYFFRPDIARIQELASGFDAMFICNPNNPTGVFIPKNDVEAICRSCPRTRVIVDESYLPFVDGWEQKSVMKSDLPNAFILHSLSKIYAIPGLRIGLLIFPEKFRKMIIRTLQPWSVSAPAQTAARYIMENKEKVGQFIKKSQRFIKIEKKKFLKQFKTARGIRFFSSQTGYMLARLSGRHSADRLVDYLSNRKILIRNCKNFKGLSDQYVRISIKNSKANKTCAENIRFFLDHINGTGRDTK